MTSPVPRAVVGALIFDPQNRLFLMRSSGKFGSQWIVPGGKVDFGESLDAALRREILEETNLKLSRIEFAGVRELIEPHRHFIFLEHRAWVNNPENVVLNGEATEYGWFKRNELKNLDIAPSTKALIDERWV